MSTLLETLTQCMPHLQAYPLSPSEFHQLLDQSGKYAVKRPATCKNNVAVKPVQHTVPFNSSGLRSDILDD